MPTLDPATGQPLPDSSIQRILFVTPTVHIYQIPPLTSSTSGFNASQWTSSTQPTVQKIFSARLRIIETSISEPTAKIKADIVLEDPSSGALFAAAPYTSPAVVQQANDSSRFFAIRVQGEGGMKATLGMGFEDRSPAFDFGIALSEVRKVLGMDQQPAGKKKAVEQEERKDFSLKEGQTINVQVGSKGRRAPPPATTGGTGDDTAALFSIAPPPPPAAGKPPASSATEGKSAAELGFDDGEFGEFQ